jgi:tRNA A-37 threonylcarbamoyl transferase component Bud32
VVDHAFSLTTDRVLAGRYRLLEPIARGGMAEVWEGRDDVLTRPVAVKILHPHLARDEGFVERFRREAVAAARLAHPGIVATYDTGEDDGVAFIVMELVRGRTLRRALEEQAPLPTATCVHVAAQVADALEHAHRAGLVHRDVKPANILLCDEPGGGVRAKVADFGIAKLQAGGDLTQTGALVGTAKYLSPEQVEGRSPDARSDVYALGVVLYEMLCGRAPFSADTELATALQHVRGQPVTPRQLRAGIPRPLEQIVLRAMAKDPENRFRSAADLRGALLAVDMGGDDADPLVVRDPTPPGGVVPLVRPPQRNWVPAVLVAAVVAVAVAVALAVLPDEGDGTGAGRGSAPVGQPVVPSAVHSFDPQGDGEEDEVDVGLAVDGDPATAWATSRYSTRDFGNLKQGVGLYVELAGARSLQQLLVRSPTRGWAAAVYVADRPGTDLADWGTPVDRRTAIDGTAVFDLDGRAGRAVLLWITDPGEGNKAEVAEMTVRAGSRR